MKQSLHHRLPIGLIVAKARQIAVLPPMAKFAPSFIPALASAFCILSVNSVAPVAANANEPITGEEIVNKIIDFQKNAQGKGKDQYCQIIISESGVLRVMPGTNRMSSIGAGTRPGRAEVFANHPSFKIHLDQPFGFRIAPANGNNNVIFTASYSGTGATNFSLVPGGSAQKLKEGVTRIETHFVADRGNDPFPAGQYNAELTLRCE